MMLALAQNVHNWLSIFFFLHSQDKLWELFCLLFAVPPSRAYQYGFEAPSEKSLSHSCLKCKLGLFIFSHLIYLSLEMALMAFFAPDHDSSTYLWNKTKQKKTRKLPLIWVLCHLLISYFLADPAHSASCLTVILLCALFIEPSVGKVRAKRLEEEAKNHGSCRQVYFLWLAQWPW